MASGKTRSGRHRSQAAVIAFLLASFPALGAEREPAGPPTDIRVYLPGAADVAAVRAALAGARRRLADPACQGLFAEFEGADGRPLAEVLETVGETGASYFDLLS